MEFNMKMRCLGAAVVAAAVLLVEPEARLRAQDPPQSAQQLFDAGQYDEALKSIAQLRAKGNTGLPEAFLAAHAALKLNQNDRAKEEFARLTASDDSIWRLVGESSTAAVDGNRDRAVELANKAVEEVKAAGTQEDQAKRLRDFYAFYQLGLARSRKDEWTQAAEAFTRATELNSGFAYAHYYAGMAYSRIKRPDQVVKYFERFLKLAPKAPERSAVASILKTIK
jgi:tetratricopeptide (TPR) repeat protein